MVNVTNHLKKVHNKDASSATEEFLDATSYSEELDMEETLLRNADREDIARNFFGDITDNYSDDENSIVTSSQHSEYITPSSDTAPAPVPLCNNANMYIGEDGIVYAYLKKMPYIHKVLATMFTGIRKKGEAPTEWAESKVILIKKDGNGSDDDSTNFLHDIPHPKYWKTLP